MTTNAGDVGTLNEREIFERNIDSNNRWAVLARQIHWDKLIVLYGERLDHKKIHARVSARTVIASLIVKYKLKLSSNSTIRLINENQYLQYFTQSGKAYGSPPLTADLLRNVRDYIGKDEWARFKYKILNESQSTVFSKVLFSLKQRLGSVTLPLPDMLDGEEKKAALKKQLYNDIGLDYKPRRSGKHENSEERHKQKMKKRARRLLDIIIWTVLILLVTASLVMIITETEWSHKKKTENRQ